MRLTQSTFGKLARRAKGRVAVVGGPSPTYHSVRLGVVRLERLLAAWKRIGK